MTESLRNLQQRFQAQVLRGQDAVLEYICQNTKPNAAARLAIYSAAYRLRLLEVLATDFPVLHTLAGDELFEQVGRAYIETHPSNHFSVRYFGQHLSSFLATDPSYRETLVLSEMAALEWALSLAFDAADANALSVATLSALPAEAWPDMRVAFHPSLQRRDFHWNVPDLWRAVEQKREPQAPRAYPQAQAWLIWRRKLQNYFRPLERAEASALDAMRAGQDFSTMCEDLCEQMDVERVGLQAARFLKQWVADDLIVGVY